MLRPIVNLTLPLALVALLAACGKETTSEPVIRAAMVTQPQSAIELQEAYPGEVRARFEPELAFRIAGKVSKRLVDSGQRVKKNQALAELDPDDMRLKLDAMRAQLAAAEANLQLVKTERDRYKTLLGRQLVSRSQYDNTENLYRAGLARLNQAKAEYKVASNQADYAVLRAPQDGVIAERMIDVGQVVSPGQTVLSLAADGDREVQIDLPEHMVSKLEIGQKVAVELWSQPGKRYIGYIREISPSADAQSRTYAARVAFNTDTTRVALGLSARVFILEKDQDALAIPLSALTAEGQQPYVWWLDPATSTLHKRPVRVGPYGERLVPVLEGLSVDDWFVLAGVEVLHEGEKVRPVDRDNRTVELTGQEPQ
ncbi:MAG: efflux transporter periplasmic adaptor subunit [Pseudomonadaceae bacterium]|nr:efflux transporter periplasmic adaptor subunit [Pseudomonadaceae bacterium]